VKVPDTKENLDRCLCKGCPSYNTCMKVGMQRLFCSRGKTPCEFERQGCFCGRCPVSRELELHNFYFCNIGASG
jgi:aldose sugar dehydrogenase